MSAIEACRKMSDADLCRSLRFLSQHEKRGIARLLLHLSEFDRRNLCPKEGSRSLFEYCVSVLGYDEYDAYRRIRGARVIRDYPAVLDALESEKISLTSLVVLHPYLTAENFRQWMEAAKGKTRRQLEALVAEKHPQAARPDFVRRLPAPGYPASSPAVHAAAAAPAPSIETTAAEVPAARAEPMEWPAIAAPPASSGSLWQEISAVSRERVRVGFDAAVALMRLIERARQILRHKYPEGRLEDILRDALETLLDRKDPQRRLELKTPRAARVADSDRLPTRSLRAAASGRYIPAKVKSAVWQRDEGRCSWRYDDGTVCGARDSLEYDHIRPYAKGGRSDDPRNIRLLCREHNQLWAEEAYGRRDGTGVSAGPAAAPPGPTAPGAGGT